MRRKTLGLMLAALGIFVGSVVYADDEKIANHLYKKLSEAKQQGSLKNFSLDMEVKDGVVYFSGHVNSKSQKTMVLTLAQNAQDLGVVEIRDGIAVNGSEPATIAKAPALATKTKSSRTPKSSVSKPTPKPTPKSTPKPIAKPKTNVVVEKSAEPEISSRARQASATKPVQDLDYLSNGPRAVAPPARVAALPTQPVPVQAQAMQAPSYRPASAVNGARYDSPGLPNYAWPSYAPHPNYGAVTYPKTYSPTAWPYIGPFYPYPQVPLGWRKVTLEWDDGWWYLDFNDR